MATTRTPHKSRLLGRRAGEGDVMDDLAQDELTEDRKLGP
jgi:hypothetical protein